MAYFTRSRARTEHRAAGVLPFCLHEGAVLVLLGAEQCRTGPGGKVWRLMWRDFGGQREAVDVDSAATAAREFSEETLGLFGACGVDADSVALAAAAVEARLRTPGAAIKVVHELKRGSYHLWCCQQPYLAPLMLRLATQQNAATGAVLGGEKTAFAWVALKDLLSCVTKAQPRYFLRCHAHVCGGEGTPPPDKAGLYQFQLHPCFASSVRIAQGQGLDALIAAAEELPLPPPPPSPRAHSEHAMHAAASTAAGASLEPAASARRSGGEVGGSPAAGVLPRSQACEAGPVPCGRGSGAPAASTDTASSLRQSRQEAVAAAVGEVVQQIAANTRARPRHRLSRKQRQKRRRQLQREQGEQQPHAGEAAAAALSGMQTAPSQPAPPGWQQQQQQQQQRRHWAQAREALDAALPHSHPRKRLCL